MVCWRIQIRLLWLSTHRLHGRLTAILLLLGWARGWLARVSYRLHAWLRWLLHALCTFNLEVEVKNLYENKMNSLSKKHLNLEVQKLWRQKIGRMLPWNPVFILDQNTLFSILKKVEGWSIPDRKWGVLRYLRVGVAVEKTGYGLKRVTVAKF